MSLTISTTDPSKLCSTLLAAIDKGHSDTWQRDGNLFSQKSGQLAQVGYLDATLGDGKVIFLVKSERGMPMRYYRMLMTRFADFAMEHGGDLVGSLRMIPKPGTAETKIINVSQMIARLVEEAK